MKDAIRKAVNVTMKKVNRAAVTLSLPRYGKGKKVTICTAGNGFLVLGREGIVEDVEFKDGKIQYAVSYQVARNVWHGKYVDEDHLLPR